MEKYKICPSCKTKNSPAVFECINCEADLTGIKITDAETEKMLSDAEAQEVQQKIKTVRICECGAKNLPNARKCSSCNEDISDITPTADCEEALRREPEYLLSSIDGRYVFKVTGNNITLGRENAMSEYLSPKKYVGRAHARITLESSMLYVEDLNSANSTYVNDKKITQKTKLEDGDELALGGIKINGKRQDLAAYFLVRVK